jgi:membrane protein
MPSLPEKIESGIRERMQGKGIFGLLYVLIEGFADQQISLWAASLVYTTLLSLVPILAVSFSVLKAFGVHHQLEIMLYYFLEPMGERGVEIALAVIKFVENINIAVLGAVGLTLLVYTAISTIGKIESGLNAIWHTGETRPLSQKFTSYLSVLLVGPVLGFTAVSLMVSLKSAYVVKKLLSVPGVGHVAYVAGKMSPYFLVWAVFTLLYIFLPHTRVRLKSALTGGAFAAVAWGVMGWAFATFVVSSSKYSGIYSGLAGLFLFLIWLYWNWLVVLAGARVACYHQHPAYFGHKPGEASFGRPSERAALAAVLLIARRFYAGGKPMDAASLASESGFPARLINEVLTVLVRQNVLATTAGASPSYLFAKDPSLILISALIEAVRLKEGPAQLPLEPGIETVLRRIDDAVSAALGNTTVEDLARGGKEDVDRPA